MGVGLAVCAAHVVVTVRWANQADRVVSKAEAEAWARANGMLFLESSAKTKIGINQVFEEVAEKVSHAAAQVCV